MRRTLILSVVFALFALTAQAGKKNPVPVYIVAGQSNTDGRVFTSELPDYIVRDGYRHCHWSYGSAMQSGNGEFELFSPRVIDIKPSGRWAYDAVVYYLLEQSLQRDFYVVKESLGGTAIDTRCGSRRDMYWSADSAFLATTAAADKGGKSLLKAFTENIGARIDKQLAGMKDGYEIKAFLWHQGESDRKAQDDYAKNLRGVIDYVRNYLVEKTGDKRYRKLPVIIGSIPQSGRGFSEGVDRAQKALAASDKNIHVIDVHDATLQRDNIHFDAKGAEYLGRKMYNKLVDLKLAGKKAVKADIVDPEQPLVAVARFKGDRDGAVSYTFDDGLLDQYTELFPVLKKLGLKATFALNGNTINRYEAMLKDSTSTDSLVITKPRMTWAMIKEMSDAGHEMTSHGWAHTNVKRIGGEALRYEVQHNDTVIWQHTGVFPRTFIYPGNAKEPEKTAFCSRDRVGTRTNQISIGSKRDAKWLKGWVEGLIKKKEWGVGMTHGISRGYDHFSDPKILFDHLAYAASLQRALWIGTFHDVSAYVAERDSVTLDVKRYGDEIIVTPSLDLDSALFTMPLTMVVNRYVKEAVQDSKTLVVSQKNGMSLVEFNPHGGAVTIIE